MESAQIATVAHILYEHPPAWFRFSL